MAMSVSQSNLLGTIIELVVMGAYTLMFLDHMKIMYRRRSTTVAYIYLLCTSITIFVLCWVHAITDSWRIYTGFTSHMDVPYSSDTFFYQNNSWDSWIQVVTFDIITVVSDLFFVFRTWVVWDKRYLICAIPFLLSLTDIGTVGYLWWALAHSSDDPEFATLLVANASQYFFSVTLALTLTCTLLIAFKLWSAQRDIQPSLISGYSGEYVYSRLAQIATIIIESSAIYSTLLIIMIITDVRGIEGFFVVLTTMPPIIGIVFSSIIVRTMKPEKQNISGNTTNSAPRFLSQHRDTETAYTTTSGDGVQIRLETITRVKSLNHDKEKFKKPNYSDPDSEHL